MATATEVITDAYNKAGINDINTALTSAEETQGIRFLNDIMSSLENDGFELGYTTVSAGGDTVTVDDGVLLFTKNQLAARIMEANNIPFTDTLVEDIKASRRSVVHFLNAKNIQGATKGTFRQIIYGAIELLNAKNGNSPITANDLTNALERMNDMILQKDRVIYNFNIGSSLDDLHGLPDWSWGWLKSELAIRLAPSFDVPINNTIVSMRDDGWKEVIRRQDEPIVANYPEIMPLGNDRYWWPSYPNNDLEHDFLTGSYQPLTDEDGNTLLNSEAHDGE